MTTTTNAAVRPLSLHRWSSLHQLQPTYALAAGVDLVVTRHGDEVSVLYGRCQHRGALLADGHIKGPNLVCGLHGWDYRFDTGVSAYDNREHLHRFSAWIDADTDQLMVDEAEVEAWRQRHPQPYDRAAYQGLYADPHGAGEEPYNAHIRSLGKKGVAGIGHHGAVSAMGGAVDRAASLAVHQLGHRTTGQATFG